MSIGESRPLSGAFETNGRVHICSNVKDQKTEVDAKGVSEKGLVGKDVKKLGLWDSIKHWWQANVTKSVVDVKFGDGNTFALDKGSALEYLDRNGIKLKVVSKDTIGAWLNTIASNKQSALYAAASTGQTSAELSEYVSPAEREALREKIGPNVRFTNVPAGIRGTAQEVSPDWETEPVKQQIRKPEITIPPSPPPIPTPPSPILEVRPPKPPVKAPARPTWITQDGTYNANVRNTKPHALEIDLAEAFRAKPKELSDELCYYVTKRVNDVLASGKPIDTTFQDNLKALSSDCKAKLVAIASTTIPSWNNDTTKNFLKGL